MSSVPLQHQLLQLVRVSSARSFGEQARGLVEQEHARVPGGVSVSVRLRVELGERQWRQCEHRQQGGRSSQPMRVQILSISADCQCRQRARILDTPTAIRNLLLFFLLMIQDSSACRVAVVVNCTYIYIYININNPMCACACECFEFE